MRRNYMLSNADIILSLLRTGYAHNCSRCERGMHVKHDSGLCVWCYNARSIDTRTPKITRTVKRRRPAKPAPQLEPAAAS